MVPKVFLTFFCASVSQKWERSWRCTCCCCCSVTKLCPILCNPMDCSMSGFPVLHWSLFKFMSSDQWCYLTISSSASPFPFGLQSFWALGYFQMSWLVTSGGQSTCFKNSFQFPFHSRCSEEWLNDFSSFFWFRYFKSQLYSNIFPLLALDYHPTS